MHMKLGIIPEKIIKAYGLQELETDGWVYIEIKKYMYVLPQVGLLAKKCLSKRLNKKRHYPCQHNPGLWRHVWRPITFWLVVDDFGIEWNGIQHAKHLKELLEENYTVSMDCKGKIFCEVTLDLKYDKKYVDLSMAGKIKK